MPPEGKDYKKLAILAVVVVLLAAGVFAFKTFFKKPKKISLPEPQKKIVENIVSENQPSYTASFSLEKTSFKVGEEVSLPVVLDSQGEEVVGFDLVLSFDPNLLEFKSVSSLNPDFTVSFFNAGDKVVATGVKAPGVKTSYVFSKDKVVVFSFLVKSPGKTELEILKTSGKDASQLINSASQKLPLEGDRIEITLVP